jgi:hypothetical protein
MSPLVLRSKLGPVYRRNTMEERTEHLLSTNWQGKIAVLGVESAKFPLIWYVRTYVLIGLTLLEEAWYFLFFYERCQICLYYFHLTSISSPSVFVNHSLYLPSVWIWAIPRLLCFAVEWDLSPLGTSDMIWSVVLASDERWWVWSSRWNKNWQGKQKYSEKICPNGILSTTNLTRPDQSSNLGRGGD